MSWSSLFAFNDANGRIGSTYTAVNSLTLDGDLVGGTAFTDPIQNLATFTSLPVGVYSVRVSIPLTNNATATPCIISNWNIGAGISNSTFTLGSNSITGFSTTCNDVASSTNTTEIISFILNNTAGTSAIYINSFIDLETTNLILEFGSSATSNSFATTASIVATKLA